MCKFEDQLTRLIIGFLIRGFAMAAIILLTIDGLKAAGKDPVLARAEISSNSSVELSANGLSIKAKRKETKDGWSISVSGKSANGPFSFYYRFKGVSDYTQYILIVELDPNNSSPEIMFRAYTGGAHCCSLPVFAYEIGRGMWKTTAYPMIDGDLLPFFEDIDGDGAGEIISIDQTFLYTFDSYAGSYSPMRVEQLRGGTIRDITRSRIGRARLKTQLDEMESDADNNPPLWRSNGFLSAWVALKSFLGEGESAWKKMLLLYDRQSDFGSYKCAEKLLAFDCPPEKLVMIPFPDALEAHLKARRYWDKGIEKPD